LLLLMQAVSNGKAQKAINSDFMDEPLCLDAASSWPTLRCGFCSCAGRRASFTNEACVGDRLRRDCHTVWSV
jgi:hypothetical protein